MAGAEKSKLLVIGKYQKPFKNVKSLPAQYELKKMWMTSQIFEAFLH
jgi:hypothetical protein